MGYGFRRIVTDSHGSDPALIRNDPSKSVPHLLTVKSELQFFRNPKVNSSDLSSLEALLRDSRRSGGKAFSYGEVATLARYYELVLKWNPRLHLTTVTDPREFFERHIVESALAEQLIHPSV